MKALISALQFLTILPIRRSVPFDPARMVMWFPVVGLIVGGLMALLDLLAAHRLPLPLVALLDVILLAVITGGLHLDGLADSADGLFSHRSRERALEIMKDSRVGVMGAMALIVVVTLKWAAIAHLPSPRWIYLVVVPAASRLAMMGVIALLPYGREQGTGKAAFETRLSGKSFAGALPVFLLSLCLGAPGLILIGALILGSALVIWFYDRQMGCVTGDMLGATCEFMEAWLWVSACHL